MKKTLLIAALAALVATSCSKRDTGSPATEPGQIKVTSTIAGAESKGVVESNAAVLTGAAFVHAQVAAAANPVSFAGVTAIAGDRAASGSIKFATAQLYDKATGKISYLMGYHPAKVATANIVTWTPDGATDILVTNLWNAGTYTAPVTTGMEFAHALARIEVKCKLAAGSGLGAVAETWGKITGIEFKDAPTTLSFDFATNAVAAGSVLANFPLLNGGAYAVGAFTPVDIAPSENIVASAMIPPTGLGAFTIILKTEKIPAIEIGVSMAASKTFVAGQVHTATLLFDANDKTIKATATTVANWGPGGSGNGPVMPPVILEAGKGKFPITGEVGPTVSYTGYNGLYGENTGVDPAAFTNGPYQNSAAEAYAAEPPYAKFEIASEEAYDGTTDDKTWTILQGTRADHTDNICVQKHGEDWRLPRLSELRLISLNSTALNEYALKYPGNGFKAISYSTYWSATEFSDTEAWYMEIEHGWTGNGYGKISTSYHVRCIRELPVPPPPPPAIGDYYYSDNTSSATFNAGKTLLGVIYRLNSDGTGMLVEVTDAAVAWGPDGVETLARNEESGVANTTTIKNIDPTLDNYPAFKHCESKNTGGVTGWYLPANKELRALYAGFCGHRWVASGANIENGEVNDWSNNTSPNINDNGACTAFNAKMTDAGGTEFATINDHWSSTEMSNNQAWPFQFSNGTTTSCSYYKAFTSTKVRCVRAF